MECEEVQQVIREGFQSIKVDSKQDYEFYTSYLKLLASQQSNAKKGQPKLFVKLNANLESDNIQSEANRESEDQEMHDVNTDQKISNNETEENPFASSPVMQ